MFKGVSFDGVLELLQEVDGLLYALGLAEVVVDKLLEFSIELRNGDVERDIFFVEVAVSEVQKVILSLSLELISDIVELANYYVHLLEIELGQRIELLNV